MKVGFIGLGSMGLAIATNLLNAGNELTVYNRSEDKAIAFAKQGGKVAKDASEAVSGDVVFSMLSDDKATESVFLDERDGKNLIDEQASHTVHVCLSTISVRLSKRLSEAYANSGKNFVAATVIGRPDVAERGELVVMAAGTKENIDKCAPLLRQIGKSLHIMGADPWQANVAKVACNFMISSMIQTMSEAFALVRKNGLDESAFYSIMANDFFASPVYAKYGKIIVEKNWHTGAFTVKMQEKDTRLVLECAQDSHVPMVLASAIENTFLSAMGRGFAESDPCSIAQLIADNAGIK